MQGRVKVGGLAAERSSPEAGACTRLA